MRRLLRAFGRDALPRRAAAPLPPPRPRAQPRPGRARRPPRRALRGHGQRPRAHARARAAAGRLRGHPRAHDARRLRAAAPRQPQPRPRHAGGDGRPLRRPSRRGRRDRAPGRHACASTSPATSATATPAPRTTGADRKLAEVCHGCFEARYPLGLAAARARPPRAWRRSCASSPRSGCRASSCCTARCSSSRARSPSRCAGRDTGARAAAARARARVVGVLDRLLPHRASRTSTRSPTSCCSGASSTRRSSTLPDIDLDFPRDVREVLIPRVHDRFGRDRAALVAAFPTYRARGAIRELGKALGPAAGGDRARRARVGGLARGGRRSRHRHRAGGRPRGRGPLALAGRAGRGGARPAPPPLPALRRHDRRHPPAGRLLPGRARRDGGAPDGHVGQGLLLGRGLPEDRPARPGDALGGRALRRA